MPDRKFGFDTLCLHAGQIPDAATGARALPIYQTTSFVFDSADHAASLFNLQTFGNVYSRISNPTVAALEERVAALEGGRAALAAATGMAAQMVALLTLCQQRRSHRRGAHALRRHVLAARRDVRAVRHRHDVRRRRRSRRNFAPRSCREHESASTPRRSAIRSSTSPTSRRSPTIAHDAGVPLVVDNTLASPYLCRPFEHGADIVVHSVTKYLGGHGTTMGGVLVESGKFPWDNGNFPQMTEPSRGYHGVHLLRDVRRLRLHDEGAHGDDAHARARRCRRFARSCCCRGSRRCTCACRGIANRRSRSRSISRRIRAVEWVELSAACRQAATTRSRSATCRAAPAASSRSACKRRRRGRRELHRGRAVPVAPRQRRRREDAGHPSGVDHAPPAVEDEQRAAGVSPEMIRLSIGLESLDDILWDIDQALAQQWRND